MHCDEKPQKESNSRDTIVLNGCIFRPSGKAEGVRRNCQDCSIKNKSEIQISSKERSQELLQTKNDALHHFIMFLLFANFPFLFLLSSRVVSHGLLLTNERGKSDRTYVTTLHKIMRSILLKMSPLLALRKNQWCWQGPRGKELRVASCQQSPRNQDCQSNSPQGIESCKQPQEGGS